MIKLRRSWTASALVVAVLVVGGCSSDEPDPVEVEQPVTVETTGPDEPAVLTLREDAEERLGIRTAPVAEVRAGGKVVLTVPYAAVVYDSDGGSWAFSMTEPRTYTRVPLTITTIVGDTAKLSAGPAVGTPVVVVGAAELVGAEAGISGEE
jgi:uncharacterized protein YcfL